MKYEKDTKHVFYLYANKTVQQGNWQKSNKTNLVSIKSIVVTKGKASYV